MRNSIFAICGTFLIKRWLRFSVAGYPCASQPHRSWMAEDIRAVLPQLHAEHPKQHGLEAAAVAEYDLYLE